MAPESDGNGGGGRTDPSRSGSRFAGQRVAPQSPNEALQPEAAPPPPPIPPSRRRPALSAFSGFLSFLLIAAVAAMFGLVWSQQRLREPGPLAADKVLYIAPGAEVPDIIAELDREGVIDSPFALNLALLIDGSRSKVKAGEYLFKQNASLRDVIDTLVNGKQVLHAITIPEGLTSEQIVERLREIDVLLGDVKDLPKEGTLLPETYKVARGTSRADLIKKMQDDQRRIVDQIWARRASDLPLRSPYELVILASIVEKETGRADERSRVASVFMNRLAKRMRLQSDPTIVYGLVGGKGTLGRGISRAELEKPTPYNTYTNDGLPQGPIANPGRAALDAVANPSRTQDLYFVADGTGGHVFAETLDQHARNVQKWRQIEKEAKDKPDKPAGDVDKAAPQVQPPAGGAARGDQHGAIESPRSVYGSLPTSFKAEAAANVQPSSLSNAPAASAIAKAAPMMVGLAPPVQSELDKKPANRGADKHGSPVSAFTMGPGLEELGITVRGVQPSAAATLDGPIGASEMVDAPPEPASIRSDPKARAAQEPLTARSDEPPLEPEESAPQPPQTSARVARIRHLDASEGKPFDPLLDKTYDLNYPKTVPALR
ncbi:endolytic transglycosylase MltG [Methylocapsa polymorpha]|uniref:Endolytic murein transglycosylase n=1 Tax=Methylocapsa polymorpha TaxID=3080828 RepID=A0ABZ0HTB4_9HYPH|nr:endolytic transglycosylase MltG [Methylocapsa sp. RX1]